MNAANTVLFNFHFSLLDELKQSREEIYWRVRPAKAVRVLEVPQTLGDTVWAFFEFATLADKLDYLQTVPQQYQIFLDEARCTQEYIDTYDH